MTICTRCGGIGGAHRWWCPSEPPADSAPAPDEVVVAGEQRDRLAEALHIVGTRPGFTELDAWTRWTTLAAAAIAALPPSPAEEAVKRVEDVLNRLPVQGPAGLEHRIRAALASPAPGCTCDRVDQPATYHFQGCPAVYPPLASPAPAPQGEACPRRQTCPQPGWCTDCPRFDPSGCADGGW